MERQDPPVETAVPMRATRTVPRVPTGRTPTSAARSPASSRTASARSSPASRPGASPSARSSPGGAHSGIRASPASARGKPSPEEARKKLLKGANQLSTPLGFFFGVMIEAPAAKVPRGESAAVWVSVKTAFAHYQGQLCAAFDALLETTNAAAAAAGVDAADHDATIIETAALTYEALGWDAAEASAAGLGATPTEFQAGIDKDEIGGLTREEFVEALEPRYSEAYKTVCGGTGGGSGGNGSGGGGGGKPSAYETLFALELPVLQKCLTAAVQALKPPVAAAGAAAATDGGAAAADDDAEAAKGRMASAARILLSGAMRAAAPPHAAAFAFTEELAELAAARAKLANAADATELEEVRAALEEASARESAAASEHEEALSRLEAEKHALEADNEHLVDEVTSEKHQKEQAETVAAELRAQLAKKQAAAEEAAAERSALEAAIAEQAEAREVADVAAAKHTESTVVWEASEAALRERLAGLEARCEAAEAARALAEEDKEVLNEALEELGAVTTVRLQRLQEEADEWQQRCERGGLLPQSAGKKRGQQQGGFGAAVLARQRTPTATAAGGGAAASPASASSSTAASTPSGNAVTSVGGRVAALGRMLKADAAVGGGGGGADDGDDTVQELEMLLGCLSELESELGRVKRERDQALTILQKQQHREQQQQQQQQQQHDTERADEPLSRLLYSGAQPQSPAAPPGVPSPGGTLKGSSVKQRHPLRKGGAQKVDVPTEGGIIQFHDFVGRK